LTGTALNDDLAAVRLPRAVFIQRFDAQALILVADSDSLVTTSLATAELIELLQQAFEGAAFTLEDLTILLQEQYNLGRTAALAEARSLRSTWLKTGLLWPSVGV